MAAEWRRCARASPAGRSSSHIVSAFPCGGRLPPDAVLPKAPIHTVVVSRARELLEVHVRCEEVCLGIGYMRRDYAKCSTSRGELCVVVLERVDVIHHQDRMFGIRNGTSIHHEEVSTVNYIEQ